MKRILRAAALAALAAIALFVAGSWLLAERLTGARPAAIGAPPQDFPYPVEPVSFASADGQTLAGWLLPSPSGRRAGGDGNAATTPAIPRSSSTKGIVLLHGYGGSRKQMLPRARFLCAAGYTTLLYDARACGESTGERISFGYRERQDVIAAVALLKERGCTDIACLGVSQGGATVLFAADDLPDLKCVICESVYDEMAHAVDGRVRHYTLMPGWLGACLVVPFAERRLELSIDEVRPVDHIARLRCPVFIVSGDEDDKTSPEDTRRLFDAAREPKELWLVPEARHEDLRRFPGYEEKVCGFLARHFDR
jgi:dipeptidyl aminopeptidase/acylaminoacyl peptidase